MLFSHVILQWSTKKITMGCFCLFFFLKRSKLQVKKCKEHLILNLNPCSIEWVRLQQVKYGIFFKYNILRACFQTDLYIWQFNLEYQVETCKSYVLQKKITLHTKYHFSLDFFIEKYFKMASTDIFYHNFNFITWTRHREKNKRISVFYVCYQLEA